MKRFSLIITLALFLSLPTVSKGQSLPVLEPTSCTSILAGKNATTDGSVITSHTCDANYRTWVDIVPGAVYERDTTMTVYKNRLHSETINGFERMTIKGTIPQAKKTFRFVDTAYPCMNEVQLGMGEATITGREELVNKNGMFMIEELQRVALQRCSTAREAITLMGKLIEEYGYGDWGESLTIADKNEAWYFEVFGEGPDKIGGVWAAVRIPDDHVAVCANNSRIGKIDIKDKENYMASKNVFDVAKKMGFWDGKEPFLFWKAYSGGNYYGEERTFHIREYFILNKLAPSLHLSFDSMDLPLSVKPDEKVSPERVMALLRETYEGTEYDVTKNLKVVKKDRETGAVDTIISPAANPWMTRDTRNMLNGIKPNTVENQRLVAVPQCSYSTVIQFNSKYPDAIGGILWLALDNPGESPRFPVFCGTTDLPRSFDRCGQNAYSDEAIVWDFRKANKLATVRWGATREDIESGIRHFEEKGFNELPFVRDNYLKILESEGEEAANEYLTGYTSDFAGAAAYHWNKLAEKFWTKFARGF